MALPVLYVTLSRLLHQEQVGVGLDDFLGKSPLLSIKRLSYESHCVLKRRLGEAEEQVNICFSLLIFVSFFLHHFSPLFLFFFFTLLFPLPPSSIHFCCYFFCFLCVFP